MGESLPPVIPDDERIDPKNLTPTQQFAQALGTEHAQEGTRIRRLRLVGVSTATGVLGLIDITLELANSRVVALPLMAGTAAAFFIGAYFLNKSRRR